jgi:hypothetical protein
MGRDPAAVRQCPVQDEDRAAVLHLNGVGSLLRAGMRGQAVSYVLPRPADWHIAVGRPLLQDLFERLPRPHLVRRDAVKLCILPIRDD